MTVENEPEIEKDELEALDALEKEASEFNKVKLLSIEDAEIDRILKAFKLDAYAVLNLQPGIPESTIKITYRKLSLLIHPDKTANPSAPDAFDRLKKAQTTLMDEKSRTHLDNCIADARMLLMRAHKFTADSPEMKKIGQDDGDAELKAEWRRRTVEVLVDEEARRRKQIKAQMQEEGREQRKQDEELESRKRRREHEVNWEKTREERIGSWRDFSAAGATVGKGGKKEGVGGPGKGVEGGQKKKKQKLKVLG